MPSCAFCVPYCMCVVADRFEVAAFADAVERALLLDVLLLVRVRHAGDDAELAEAIAEDRAPVLAGRAVGDRRAPLRLSSARPKRGDLVGAEADVRRVDAAAARSCRRECCRAARGRRCRSRTQSLPLSGLSGIDLPVAFE